MATEPLFSMYRGDDHGLRITVKDAAGNAIDLTGWTFRATMKLHTEQADADAPVKVDVGPLSNTNATFGIVELTLPNSQTKDLLATKYHFDVEREQSGNKQTVVQGVVEVLADVTQRT